MESVPAGVASSHPVTTAGASAAQRQRSTDAAADAAWTIGVTEMKPKRNAVRLLFSIEDAARIPGLESLPLIAISAWRLWRALTGPFSWAMQRRDRHGCRYHRTADCRDQRRPR